MTARRLTIPLFVFLVLFLTSAARVAAEPQTLPAAAEPGEDPDVPRRFLGNIDKETFLRLRDQEISILRGFDDARRLPYNPRQKAIELFERQQKINVVANPVTWTEIGPQPIPNGQTQVVTNSVTGRMTAIAIDPTNNNRIYLGTAFGGLWRSLDGGTTWTPIFDSAQSLAIGALALAPSDPTILYVGTGEANGSADSFAGVGLYRIENAPTTATLVGPINPVRNYIAGDGVTPRSAPVFNGRSIEAILVHPTDPATVFVGTAGGVIGMGGDAPFGGFIPPLGMRGLYRSTNATAAPGSVTFTKLAVTLGGVGFDLPNTGNRNADSLVFPDPADPNQLVVWINGNAAANDGGVFRSTNALAATPSFTQVFTTGTSGARALFANYVQGSAPTNVIYVATGESRTGTGCTIAPNNGALRVSTDGGATWSAKLAGGGGFCGGQCFYNFGLDVRPGATAAVADDILWLGGNTQSATCNRLHAKSTDGGTTFTNFANGLHADTHFIKVDPTNPSIVYHGNDGGIFKSIDGGSTWVSLNNSPLSATQFQSVATHSADANYSIGGTQDNGTNMYTTAALWNRVDFGDGGYARIDQSTASTSTVTLYHTYFNQTGGLIGFARTNTTACGVDGEWSFKGRYGGLVDTTVHCDGTTDTFNGMSINDAVNFYAPLELGPGTPNTVYYGTDRLYRSADKGDTATLVSQAPITASVAIRTIGISRLNDNFRMVGLVNGHVWATTTGSSTLTDVTTNLTAPLKQVLRVAFDPNDATGNTAYVTLGGYWGNTTGHVFKTTNLTAGAGTTWAAASGTGGTSIPDVPVNCLLIDPLDSNNVYAGTDIGVYYSSNGGSSWNPLGSSLPRVSIFEMALSPGTPATRVIRIATHGRGMWELIPPATVTLADLAITKTDGQTTAGPGASVTYTIVASNAGPNPVTGATVTDTLPVTITAASWTCVGAGGGTCTASGSGNINNTVNLPVGGSVTYTLTGTINPAATGTLSNTAAVAVPGGVTDPNPANNSATDTDVLTPQANLGITKTVGLTKALPGQVVTYTIVASNAGPNPVTGATVTDTVPATITGPSWTCAGAGGGTCTASGSGNINNTVNLPVGGSVTYTLTGTVSASAAGIVSNTASVAVPGGVTDPNPANNSATASFTVGAKFYLLTTPCRVLDTRGGVALAPNSVRNLMLVGACGLPSGITAAATNVTVVLPAAEGYVTLYPGPSGSARPFASTINYTPNRTLANNANASVAVDGTINIFNSGLAPLEFLIDVTGYFK